ncbi:MAG TPA: APC family permease [Xanthomonadaceae bacterium]|nr:APC family permease [Xanthomonadaceae bacterium]
MNESNHARPDLLRVVSRWQIVALSVNGVIGSGIYLLPATAALLLGPASLWAVLLAGLAVALIVLCFAQAGSYFDQPGGAYLYTREAFGDFVGFQVGWMTWLTRISAAAALSNGLAMAVSQLWPAAASGWAQALVILLGLGLVTGFNLVGVRSGARLSVVLVIGKLLPLAFLIAVGAFFIDWSRLAVEVLPARAGITEAALLLLFAYAGFENSAAAAGEFRNPKRDLPFALLAMIAIVTLVYFAIQAVALGTLPDLATSTSPLAEAAGMFAGQAAVLLLTVGAVVSILGTISNTTLFGPRYLYALSKDGYGPAVLGRVHPRWRTPDLAILLQFALSLALALSGSFVELALLSVLARLFAYIGTAASVLVLRRRFAGREGAFELPGGPLVPLLAIGVSLALLSAASWRNLAAAGVAVLVGVVIFVLRRATDTTDRQQRP